MRLNSVGPIETAREFLRDCCVEDYSHQTSVRDLANDCGLWCALERKTPPTNRLLTRAVRVCFPDVEIVRRNVDGESRRYLVGLRVNRI